MAYQVLARKWRPQDFSEVIGQEAVVTALRNAVAEQRIAHAYLFSGIRGVGKTSVARILAKGLNCERGPAAEPCNDCGSCREITAGSSFDVIEVDAATYSKVEQVRELTESLKYGPAHARFKVVILDEIHRLSRQAFDALLKIVEEPPDHLVFIFATTESDAVPATILSRCQEFRFRRVPLDELALYLDTVAKREKISVGPSALRIIAQAGDGSVRDAIALLDQLATFGSGSIDDGDAVRLLGGLDQRVFRDVLTAIGAGDRKAIADITMQIEEQGWDPRFVFGEFLSYCQMALHLCLGADLERLETTREEADALAAVAKTIGYEQILRTLNLLLQSEMAVRRSESAALALEIAWLRAAELPKLVAIETLLAGNTQVSPVSPVSERPPVPELQAKRSASPAPKSPKSPKSVNKKAPTAAPGRPLRQATATPSGSDPTPSPGDGAGGDSGDPSDERARFLAAVGRNRQALAAHLSGANSLTYSAGVLRISVPPGDGWLRDRLDRAANRQVLEDALAATWNTDARWEIVEEDVPEPESKSAVVEASEAAQMDPRVQTVLAIFGGSVEAVEPHNET
ncbi:MAG: DNA polymerase III subunit gamma/tau [Acidobacteria bacterium]|nr:DNA polymerase III subunit gamma/tau [Acidobacteriota bacterium]